MHLYIVKKLFRLYTIIYLVQTMNHKHKMTYSIMNCEHLNEVVHGVGLLVNPSMANAKKAMV
jgi:hypothetical protein